ncbi:MAG: hypothetical protein ACRD4I_14070, partial [Candidatus Angelobacter sp.]
HERSAHETVPFGFPAADQKTEGIPLAALSQICAPPGISSGKQTMLINLMAQFTARESFCALIDASDSFDPASAQDAGVDLKHVLWTRCSGKSRLLQMEQAFKAADIVLHNGGFGLVVVDLSDIEEKIARKVPLTTWYRFARVVERMRAALLFMMSYPAAQSCAALTLHFRPASPSWEGPSNIAHAQVLAELEFEVEVGQSRMRRPVQVALHREKR